MTSSQKKLSLSIVKLSSSIVIYLASQGADFTILNTSGQSPLDLCSDPALLKILEKCQLQEQHIQNGMLITQQKSEIEGHSPQSSGL